MDFAKMLKGEDVIRVGKANRSTLFNAQGGELLLTNKRLLFVGHGLNIGKDTISINLEDISSCGLAYSIIIFLPLPIPNAFKVVTKDGKEYKFSVWRRMEWLVDLSSAINGDE